MTTQHPSELALETWLMEPAQSAAASHIESCPSCQQQIEKMKEEGTAFRTSVFPRTIDAVLAGSAYGLSASKSLRRLLTAAGVLIPAAAAVMVMVRSQHPVRVTDGVNPQADLTQTKGSADPRGAKLPSGLLDFNVWVGTPQGAKKAMNGSVVPADAQLRFKVNAPETCWFSVLSIDSTGAVSHLYPAEPGGIEVPRADLKGGAALDGQTGLERIFALCSPRPLIGVEDSVRASISGAGAARDLTRLPGLPSDVLQGSVLLEKRH